MYKMVHFLIGIMGFPILLFAQDHHFQKTDTFKNIDLENVVVIAQHHVANKKTKVLSSLDNYLESNTAINMVRRGAYAWEPLLNGMGTERSVITIDGMRIYGACTDKMDPITSYVEITNLSKANIYNGSSGSAHGATIAGNIDLMRRKSGFNHSGFKGTVFAGMETNNWQKMLGTTMQYASPKFYTDIDFIYRDADNYKAGGGNKIAYSQFTKYNISAITGFKLSKHEEILASLIYDKAIDIGYPALPMDVALAEAFIGSVQYERHHITPNIHHWETKLYYNQITHIMDDTQRPDVHIRMDMPGWSKTGGYYSKLIGKKNKHHWNANISGHFNYSLAEMTMFSNKPGEKDMFMLTWPGVQTINNQIFIEDKIVISNMLSLSVHAGIGNHLNRIKDNLGYESLLIFYPEMSRSRSRWLKNAGYTFSYQTKKWQHSLGMGFGERAPSVSEAYGYYLFNSADKYDYMGNPHMNNEKSIEINAATVFAVQKLSVKLQSTYFSLFNYIIGKPQASLIPMTIGAKGIKVYEQLSQAHIINTSLSAAYRFSKKWQLSGDLIYRKGMADSLDLPQIQPLTYRTTLQYQYAAFLGEASMNGALAQNNFSALFGESYTAAYTVFNVSASYQIKIHQHKINVKAGVENVFDRYYTTFASWNKVPQMGRNVFINLIYSF